MNRKISPRRKGGVQILTGSSLFSHLQKLDASVSSATIQCLPLLFQASPPPPLPRPLLGLGLPVPCVLPDSSDLDGALPCYQLSQGSLRQARTIAELSFLRGFGGSNSCIPMLQEQLKF